MKPLAAALLAAALLAAALHAETIEVSPGGPIRTLAAARDAVRAYKRSGGTAPVTVRIRAGRYFLDEPLTLTAEDSGSATQPIVWEAAPGETVLISGGRVITGWRKGAGSLYTVSTEGLPHFRQLWISGRRATRARTPNQGYFRIDGPSSQDKPFRLHYRGNDIKPDWAARGDVEVIALLAWADIRMPIVSVDEAARTATLGNDPRPSNKEPHARYWIENAPDALDAAGEWFLDRQTRTLSYWPVSGEDPTREETIIPVLTQLVRIQGRPETGEPVRNVTFRNLAFAHTDWTMDAKGYADTQAAVAVPAAFDAVGAMDCAVENSRFFALGGYGIWFGRGAQRNRVVGNEVFDAGAGGVRIGETAQREREPERSFDNVVTDNHLHHLGRVYPPAVGIWVGQSSGNTLSHNHIHDLYYTAISVGWTWGYGPNQSKGNRIENNWLHHIGLNMLSDMGAIYTLGVQPGTVIRGNRIHDVWAFTYGGWGIYPDEGSSDMLIENNVVYRTKSAGFHQHYGRGNVVRNNIFAYGQEFQLMRTRAEAHLSFTFEGNIVLFDHGRLLGSNWSGDQFRMKRNLYWDARGMPVRFGARSLDEWQAAGQDEDSRVADPLFADPGAYDFRLRPGSPALEMGFTPIDLSRCGPRLPAP